MALPVAEAALPDLSSSTSTVLSTQAQNRIGERVYLELKESGQLSSDPIVNSYIDELGQRLLMAVPYPPQSFTFFVVDNPQINAFAMFGGYIGVYSGLIRAAQNESEMASVIAHEIAHVTQDHLRRNLERSKRMDLPISAAILAAIVLGQSAPEVAEATLTTAVAGYQQQRLSFSRDHEQEADRLGIERLASAHFNPEAMAQFFSLIKKNSRYSTVAPEYLQTHPVTIERISEAQNRAHQLDKTEHSSTPQFSVIQARLAFAASKDIAALIRSSKGQDDLKSRYTLALALLDERQYRQSLRIIRELGKEFTHLLPLQLTEAKIYMAMNNRSRAESSYKAILEVSPYNRVVINRLAELYLLNNESKKGAAVLLKLAHQTPLKAAELRLLAKISNAQGDRVRMHLNIGNALALEKKYGQALSELFKAKRLSVDNFYLNNRIEARIEEIEESVANQSN